MTVREKKENINDINESFASFKNMVINNQSISINNQLINNQSINNQYNTKLIADLNICVYFSRVRKFK